MDQIMNRPVPLISLDPLPEVTRFHQVSDQKFDLFQRRNEHQLNASVGHIKMGAIVRHFSQWYAVSAIVNRKSECQIKQRERVSI